MRWHHVAASARFALLSYVVLQFCPHFINSWLRWEMGFSACSITQLPASSLSLPSQTMLQRRAGEAWLP